MAEVVRWNIKVSKETDLTLRTFLGSRGMKKGDLSKFIEEAVRLRVFELTVKDIKARNSTIATDSFKYVKLGGGFGMAWIYGNPPALVNAAVTGVFTPSARWDYFAKPRKERLASEKERPLYSQPFVD